MQTELRTERLWMRRAQPDDLDALHAIHADFDVVRQTASWPWPPDRAFSATRCQPADPARGMAGPIFANAEMVGMMGILDREMGYGIARAHWGRGYATEMGRALIAHVWASHDWPTIEACVFTDNPASARVLEKLGFAEGAACESACAARGRRFATRTFRLARPSP